MTAWYHSQIVGVIVGALAVFVATEAHEMIQNRREKRSLKAGIISEIRILLGFLEESIESFEVWKNEIEENIVRRWKWGSPGNTTFIDSNLDKLGRLDSEFIPKVIEFRMLVGGLNGAHDILQESIDKYQQSKGYIELVKANVDGMMKGTKNLIKLGKEIIQ